MLRFFREEVSVIRFPRSIEEGAIKGFMLGAMILGPYDFFSPIPKTAKDSLAHSRSILDGYGFFLALGILLGLIGELCLHENRHQAMRP